MVQPFVEVAPAIAGSRIKSLRSFQTDEISLHYSPGSKQSLSQGFGHSDSCRTKQSGVKAEIRRQVETECNMLTLDLVTP